MKEIAKSFKRGQEVTRGAISTAIVLLHLASRINIDSLTMNDDDDDDDPCRKCANIETSYVRYPSKTYVLTNYKFRYVRWNDDDDDDDSPCGTLYRDVI